MLNFLLTRDLYCLWRQSELKTSKGCTLFSRGSMHLSWWGKHWAHISGAPAKASSRMKRRTRSWSPFYWNSKPLWTWFGSRAFLRMMPSPIPSRILLSISSIFVRWWHIYFDIPLIIRNQEETVEVLRKSN